MEGACFEGEQVDEELIRKVHRGECGKTRAFLIVGLVWPCRKFKNGKLAADPTWTIEKEMAIKRGVEYIPPPAKVGQVLWLRLQMCMHPPLQWPLL